MNDNAQHYDGSERPESADWHTLWRLLHYARPYWWVVGIGLLLLVINALLAISTTFLIQIGIDDYISTGDVDGLRTIALLYITAICLMLIASYSQLYLTIWLGQHVQHDIRVQVFTHLQRMELPFLDKNPIGRLITRVTNDVSCLNELFSSSIITIIGEGLTLVLIVAALLYYNWRLALLTFVVLPILAAIIIWFRSRIRRQYQKIRTRIARLNSFVQEHVSGIEQVQLSCSEKICLSRFKNINRQLRSSQLKSVYFSALFSPMIEIIGALSLAILMYAGGIRITEGLLTFGELVAFIHLVERFYQPVQSLSEEFNILQSSLAASDRIFQLLDSEPTSLVVSVPDVNERKKDRISLNQVWFAYAEDNWVLRNISLDIAPGEKLAIVGATGAGKTSLISLICRFYDYQRGEIRLDGELIDTIPVDRLRSRLGLIPQDFFIFSGTIADNVRLGDLTITDDDIVLALGQVGLNLTPERFPDGINTRLSERGATLSTGQKQLLSFARALAFNPEILILDEATSSIDTETEHIIQLGLDRMLENRTAIIIAHRLSTIHKADRIAVMHHGELRELGNHEELMQTKGIYTKLYNIHQETSN